MMNLEKSKWCLEPDTLFNLALNMKTTGKIQSKVSDKGIEEFSIVLKSSAVQDVFYEIIIRRGPAGGEIAIDMADGETEERVRVYENGRICRWGAWALELMETLPPIIARESFAATSVKGGNAKLENVLFVTLDRRVGEFFMDEEHSLLDVDRSGMPLHAIR